MLLTCPCRRRNHLYLDCGSCVKYNSYSPITSMRLFEATPDGLPHTIIAGPFAPC